MNKRRQGTHERGVGDGPRSGPERAVEEVAQAGVLLEVGLLKLIKVAAESVRVELEAGLAGPDGQLRRAKMRMSGESA